MSEEKPKRAWEIKREERDRQMSMIKEALADDERLLLLRLIRLESELKSLRKEAWDKGFRILVSGTDGTTELNPLGRCMQLLNHMEAVERKAATMALKIQSSPYLRTEVELHVLETEFHKMGWPTDGTLTIAHLIPGKKPDAG